MALAPDAADGGSPVARNRLGKASRDRVLGVPADAGHAAAQYMIGLAAEARPDEAANALTGYRKAADQALGNALARLGQAYEMFKRVAEAGAATGIASLAKFTEDGRGIEPNPAGALVLWRQAADKGQVDAEFRLGYALQFGELGLSRDETEAVRWYRLAAAQDSTAAQVNLGAMLLTGAGTVQNGAEALKWYRRAAEHGNLTGEFMVGAVLWDGKAGQAQDRTEAVRHFRIAAEAGNPAAQRMLATAYRLGDGVPEDIGQMLVWNRKAAEQGDGLAEASLGYAILTGLDGTYDFVEAACWLILAV